MGQLFQARLGEDYASISPWSAGHRESICMKSDMTTPARTYHINVSTCAVLLSDISRSTVAPRYRTGLSRNYFDPWTEIMLATVETAFTGASFCHGNKVGLNMRKIQV